VILDTNGNIFGGFTPVAWESRAVRPFAKADDNMKSFLFTLRNPHNFPARRFGLKAEEKYHAISCGFDQGPDFLDMGIYDNCNVHTRNYTMIFGSSYTNDIGLRRDTFFTGLAHFQVNEIEIFEITD
jgi:hypothetical protein